MKNFNLKEIPNYPNYYASKEGDIYTIRDWGDNIKKCKTRVSHNGYIRVCVIDDNFCKKEVQVHTLIAKTFLEKIEGKPFVNHKDLNKTNNHIDNLEYVTSRENMQHWSNIVSEFGVGVSKSKHGFVVRITFNYKTYHIGTFKDPETAKTMYYQAEQLYLEHGEEALFSFIRKASGKKYEKYIVDRDGNIVLEIRKPYIVINGTPEQLNELSKRYQKMSFSDNIEKLEWLKNEKLKLKTQK